MTDIHGRSVAYVSIWQRLNLVLVAAPREQCADVKAIVETYEARLRDEGVSDTTCVGTDDTVAGLPSPGLLVADRWGEIVFVTRAPLASQLPTAAEVLEWISYVRQRCPECEGETR